MGPNNPSSMGLHESTLESLSFYCRSGRSIESSDSPIAGYSQADSSINVDDASSLLRYNNRTAKKVNSHYSFCMSKCSRFGDNSVLAVEAGVDREEVAGTINNLSVKNCDKMKDTKTSSNFAQNVSSAV